mmetsp:Transcript_18463/g.26051  ORF Transcript_18463/g.26051 Transcript_18463/m.26051 type:complete len:318 (+) Transcript_18463:118-1071(+)
MSGCDPPDVCREDDLGNKFIPPPPNPNQSRFERIWQRDQTLIRACVALIILMNISTGRYVLYPFAIFATWIHEMCHGLAACLVGGKIDKLYIYKDGSGLAYTYSDGSDWKRAFIASAGYQGTALVGGMLLLCRRLKYGPTVGIIGIGAGMLLSCALVVRNQFGLIFVSLFGFSLCILGWKFRAGWVEQLFAIISATCALNAVDDIHDLFAPGMGYVGGEPRWSDAHTVAEKAGMTYKFWATCWLIFALFMTTVGIIFALEDRVKPEDSTLTSTPALQNDLPSVSVYGNGNSTNGPPSQMHSAQSQTTPPDATVVQVY